MNDQEIHLNLQEIFRDVFDERDLSISRVTCATDIEDWDSLAQINLIVAIEQRFDIKLQLKDLAVLNDVGDMLDLISRTINR